MKKSPIGIGMLAVACVVCGPVFAVTDVPHHPVTTCANGTNPLTTPYGAPATASVAGSIPIFSLMPALDNPVTSWPSQGNWDFCAALDSTACSFSPLIVFSAGLAHYGELFRCSIDINGPINFDPHALSPWTPNGIPDGEYELGLLAAVLNNTHALNPAVIGGVTNEQVLTTFKANFDYFRVMVTTAFANVPNKSDLRNLVPSVVGPYMHTGLATVFAGYATEGDADSVAALNSLIAQLGELGFALPAGGVGSRTTGFGSILGPHGDADGDGFSNQAEYDYFMTLGAVETIAAQLDAATTPVQRPITGGIVINENLPSTKNPQVTLALNWSRVMGPAVVRMRFSDDGATWTAWEPVQPTRAYTLPAGDGYKTVRVQYLDKLNGRSAVFKDHIMIDTTPPTGGIIIDNGMSVSISPSVTLGLTWSDGAGSGVTRTRFSDDGAHWTAWKAPAAASVHTLSPPNGHHTVRVQFRDAVGNNSPVYSDYINLQVP